MLANEYIDIKEYEKAQQAINLANELNPHASEYYLLSKLNLLLKKTKFGEKDFFLALSHSTFSLEL